MSSRDKMMDYYMDHKLKLEDKFSFKCKECGSCCRCRQEPIIINGVDIYRGAKHLGIDIPEFMVRYTYSYIGDTSNLPVVVLKERQDGSCSLLRNGKCTIHQSKPAVCAIYPLGRMISYGEDSTGQYEYFQQPNQCPGEECRDEDVQHTVREWIESFHLTEYDKEYIGWSDMVTALSVYMNKHRHDKKAQLNPAERISQYHLHCLNAMYLYFDPAQPFLQQLENVKHYMEEVLPGIKL